MIPIDANSDQRAEIQYVLRMSVRNGLSIYRLSINIYCRGGFMCSLIDLFHDMGHYLPQLVMVINPDPKDDDCVLSTILTNLIFCWIIEHFDY